MPKRGENIYKRKDSRWEGRYIKGYDSTGKKMLGYVYAKTYREVRIKLAEAKQQHSLPASCPSEKKFSCYCEEWLLLSRNRVKESTYVKYYNIVYKHLIVHLGDCFPHNLTTIRIEEFSSCLLYQGLSPKTVHDILVVVNTILKYCRKQPGVLLSEPDII